MKHPGKGGLRPLECTTRGSSSCGSQFPGLMHTFDAHPTSAPTPCGVIKTCKYLAQFGLNHSNHLYFISYTLESLVSQAIPDKARKSWHVVQIYATSPPDLVLLEQNPESWISEKWKQLLLKQPTNMNNNIQSVGAVRPNLIIETEVL